MNVYDLHTQLVLEFARRAGRTSDLYDLLTVALALRAARDAGCYDEALSIIKANREEWRTRKFLWQRRWQRETRRPSRARHHDSISIRERYVRTA